MKKYFNKTVSIKVLTYLLLAALLISVALLFRLGLYSTPWYDDYTYSKYTRSFQKAYGAGLFNAIRGACFQVRESWYSWQGTFSSIFLMALSPMGFNERYYFIGSFVLISLLAVSTVTVSHVISRRVFEFPKYHSWCFSFAMAILVVWRVFNVNQAFYWYNGGMHYVGMHSFLMFFVAAIVCLMKSGKGIMQVPKIVVAAILALICSGANYMTALQGILLLLVITVYCAIKERKKAFAYLPIILVYAFGMFMNVSAQGNIIRSEYFEGQSYSPIKAILYSFYEALKNMWEFTGLFTVVFMIALAPIVWRGLENTGIKFKLPGVFAVLAFCFYATSYTPSLYGMGSADMERLLNAAKITYQFMLILTEVYFIGWLKGKLSEAKEDIGYLWVYALCVIVLAVPFMVSADDRLLYSPYGAYYYVHTGEAAAYYDGYLRRIESIKEQGADARVVVNIFMPKYIFSGELSTDPNFEPNKFMADWYGKNSLAVIEDAGE